MRRINRVQRLARREEKDTVRRIFLLSAVSVVLIFILLTVGVAALGKFADFLGLFFKGQEAGQTEETNIPAPILDTVSDMTNNENFKLTGFSASGEKVEIYKNDEIVGEIPLESGKFEHEILLEIGENRIAAKAIGANGRSSDFSPTVVMTLDKTEPKLEVTNPQNDQSFFGNNRITVEGKTEKDAQVFVNNFLANVGVEGDFDALIALVDGDNEVEVKALDEAGNSNIVKIKVNFRK